MAKVTRQRAGKDYPAEGIKKGDEYYSWTPGFRGRTMRSKTPPRPSQLTANDFLIAYYGVVEEIEDALADVANADKPILTADEYGTMRDGWVSNLEDARDELQDKFDNMPQGFQEGDTGQTMTERIDAAGTFANELTSVDFDEDEMETEGAEDADDIRREHFQTKLQECLDSDPGL